MTAKKDKKSILVADTVHFVSSVAFGMDTYASWSRNAKRLAAWVLSSDPIESAEKASEFVVFCNTETTQLLFVPLSNIESILFSPRQDEPDADKPDPTNAVDAHPAADDAAPKREEAPVKRRGRTRKPSRSVC